MWRPGKDQRGDARGAETLEHGGERIQGFASGHHVIDQADMPIANGVGGSGRDREGVAHVFPALFRPQLRLRGGLSDANGQTRLEPEPQCARQRTGDGLRLVEAALGQAIGTQRHGQQQRWQFDPPFAHGVGQQLRAWVGQRQPGAEFERQQYLVKGRGIGDGSDRFVESGRALQAVAANSVLGQAMRQRMGALPAAQNRRIEVASVAVVAQRMAVLAAAQRARRRQDGLQALAPPVREGMRFGWHDEPYGKQVNWRIISPDAVAMPPFLPEIRAATIDPGRVRDLFAAPDRLAASAFLRRKVSARMQERLDLLTLQPRTVLDAGCGEGDDLLALGRRYPEAALIGVDASSAMLALARTRFNVVEPFWRRWLGRAKGAGALPQWLCADFAATPLPDGSADLLWSNLALHWHPEPGQALAEWIRLLRENGALLFSCFGPDTFKEVRAAFAGVDDYPHTLSFADMHDLGDMLLAAGAASPVMDMETITLTYESAADLIDDVRAFGGNPLAQRRRGMLSGAQGKRVRLALEAMRDTEGRIPLTLEIIYGHAHKQSPDRKGGESVVRFVTRANS